MSHNHIKIDSQIKPAHHDAYKKLYEQSVSDPETFWGEQGLRLDWIKPYTKVKNTRFEKPVSIKWYEDGTLNACYNCLDRHLPHKANDIAFYFEADAPDGDHQIITYAQAFEQTCRMANILKDYGVEKGDRVAIYMPMIAEAVYAMLACARIGAVHSVVFGGFSPDALAGRIQDCGATCLITTDIGYRGGKIIPLKDNADKAMEKCPSVRLCLTLKRGEAPIAWQAGRDIDMKQALKDASPDCPVTEMNAEDPLFILYTSGSTGKPKGVLHTTGGYLVYAAFTHEQVFNYQSGDIYWCTADVGWVTGHSYIVYGPLANGASSIIFEGVPNYPDAGRFWQIIEKYKANIFYTAPTAIRALMRESDDFVTRYNRDSLRILGSVGEPINPEAWYWYYQIVGNGKCPIVDTWWQTETGGIAITSLPHHHELIAGWATQPFYGIQPALFTDKGEDIQGAGEGILVLKDSWPGQMRTVYGDHQRFEETYFSTFNGVYFCGDGAERDAQGNYRITGRVDDVINVSGHRFGTAEIESALVEHDAVAEAAVVGFPHDLTGQGIYAFVTLKLGIEPSTELEKQLVQMVRDDIGAIAKVNFIQFTPSLPKTRSGKIMRRILRKIAANEYGELGDISTLADPNVVQDLIEQRKNR